MLYAHEVVTRKGRRYLASAVMNHVHTFSSLRNMVGAGLRSLVWAADIGNSQLRARLRVFFPALQ